MIRPVPPEPPEDEALAVEYVEPWLEVAYGDVILSLPRWAAWTAVDLIIDALSEE